MSILRRISRSFPVGLSILLSLILATIDPISAGPAIDYSISGIDYAVDSTFIPAIAPWDMETVGEESYQTSIKEDITSGQVIQITVEGETLAFQPMALQWTNDLDMIQQVSMPVDVPEEEEEMFGTDDPPEAAEEDLDDLFDTSDPNEDIYSGRPASNPARRKKIVRRYQPTYPGYPTVGGIR